jgi:ADP-ribose pyrophosphatase
MARQILYTGRKIQVALDVTVNADGTPVRRDVVLHPGAVAILPLIDDEQVCLIRNERMVVGETLLEIPAGTLEPPEAPEAAAVRELAEETGYRAGRWDKLTEFYPSPGVLNERTHLFLARELTPGAMNLDHDEHIHPEIVAWRQALSWVREGVIRDAKTMIAILLWERLRRNVPSV